MNTETIAVSAAMAAAAGLIGCFAVIRRMALSADALSHVALPGIGVAIALRIDPLLGAAAMLFFGALLVWALEDRARMDTETIVGVVFSAALAVGALMTSGEDLLEALLGGPGTMSTFDVAFGFVGAVAVAWFVLARKHALVVALVSPDIARTSDVNVKRLNLGYLLMFALTIALGLRYLGVLLMGSLIIIPAAVAKRVSHSLNQMLGVAVGVAVAATIAGTALAAWLHRDTGPVIVTLAALTFVATLVGRRT